MLTASVVSVLGLVLFCGSAPGSAQSENDELKCDFENDMCRMTSDPDYSAPWTRVAAADEPNIPNLNDQATGHFAMMKPKIGIIVAEYEGYLQTPTNFTIAQDWCMSFAFYINSSTSTGSLELKLEQNQTKMFFRNESNVAGRWQYAAFSLQSSNVSIALHGILKNEKYVVAIDNLFIGPCTDVGNITTPAPSTQTSTQTTHDVTSTEATSATTEQTTSSPSSDTTTQTTTGYSTTDSGRSTTTFPSDITTSSKSISSTVSTTTHALTTVNRGATSRRITTSGLLLMFCYPVTIFFLQTLRSYV